MKENDGKSLTLTGKHFTIVVYLKKKKKKKQIEIAEKKESVKNHVIQVNIIMEHIQQTTNRNKDNK